MATHCAFIKPLVHDVQSLQLCAIHTVNNLLQLSPSSSKESSSLSPEYDMNTMVNDMGKEEWRKQMMLVNGKLLNTSRSTTSLSNNTNILGEYATKKDFDMLADNLIWKEQALMAVVNDNANGRSENNNGDEGLNDISNNDDSKQHKISLWKSLRNNHRTPITGNYSFEVSFLFLS